MLSLYFLLLLNLYLYCYLSIFIIIPIFISTNIIANHYFFNIIKHKTLKNAIITKFANLFTCIRYIIIMKLIIVFIKIHKSIKLLPTNYNITTD